MDDLEIIITSDGSHSLRNKQLDETYHSTHGAIRESLHVFIENGLSFASVRNNLKHVSILEIGFGTGLNAMLTLEKARQLELPCHYTTIEAFPLDESLIRHLNYPAELKYGNAAVEFAAIHEATWGKSESINEFFTLEKINRDLQKLTLGHEKYDVIYFDAFAPSKQPAMWELSILENVEKSMKPGGVFVTYCAKGQLKRDLASLGLIVETLAGPPGKKEMVRARKG